jgi:hypothetical protein
LGASEITRKAVIARRWKYLLMSGHIEKHRRGRMRKAVTGIIFAISVVPEISLTGTEQLRSRLSFS